MSGQNRKKLVIFNAKNNTDDDIWRLCQDIDLEGFQRSRSNTCLVFLWFTTERGAEEAKIGLEAMRYRVEYTNQKKPDTCGADGRVNLQTNDSPPRTAAKPVDTADVGHEPTPSTRATPVNVPPDPEPAKPSPRLNNGLQLIGNNSRILITHVKNHRTVYLRGVAEDAAFKQMIEDIAAAAATAPSLQMDADPREQIVLARSYDRVYRRGMVVSCDENAGMVRVRYIDYGGSEEVPFSALKKLPTELKYRPLHTYMVELKNVNHDAEPNEMADMEDHLKKMVDSQQLLKIAIENRDEIWPHDTVQLIDVVSNRSVNEHLNSLAQKRYYVSDLAQKVLKVDAANLPTLIAIDTQRVDNNMMTCMCHDDVQLFMEKHEETQTYGDAVKNAPAYQPKKKELCVVGVDDGEGGQAWFRAMYQTDLVDDRARVYCIDYDHINVVRAIDIRAMSSEMEHEITSFVCYIKNGDSVSGEKRMKYFEEHGEFKPTGIEFDAANNRHVITVDFSGARPASH